MTYTMRSTEALPTDCPNGGQHDNELCLRLFEFNDGEGNYGVMVVCPSCEDHSHLEGSSNLTDYLACYTLDDVFRLNNYGVITWEEATAVATARADKELEEGHASCLNCGGVFAATTDTECAWCGADVTPQLPKTFVDVSVTRVNHSGVRYHITDTKTGKVTYMLNNDVLQVVDTLTDSLEVLQDVSVWAGDGTAGKMIQAEIDRRLELHWKKSSAEHKESQGN